MQDGGSMESFSVESSCKSGSKASTLVSMECIKRGSTRGYQTKAENINMMQNAGPDKFRSSFDAGDQLDKVLSGESLYKTFTFEQSSNEEDVEKCIAFWKSVMHKNLEPIKCSIIESTKAKTPPKEPEKEDSLAQSEDHFEDIKNAEAKIHEFYKNMWNNTLEEIHRRKLNQIKLIGKSRCKMCETQISDTESDSQTDKEEIVELNSWEPKLGKTGSASRFARYKTTATAQPSEEPPVEEERPVCICDPLAEETAESASVDTVVCDKVRVQPDTNRYKLLDVIQQKKKDGTYTRWRKGVRKPCTCGIATCDCNKNPAIVSMIPEEQTCGCGQLKCRCKVAKEEIPTLEGKPSFQEPEQVEVIEDSEPVYCNCGSEHCTCNKRDMLTESEATVELLPGVPVAGKSQSFTSEQTIIVQVGEKIPRHLTQVDDIGPIKRDSKADVTKTTSETDSRNSAEIPRSVSETWKCVCKGECKCKEAKTEEETKEGAKEVLQLHKK